MKKIKRMFKDLSLIKSNIKERFFFNENTFEEMILTIG